MKTYKLSLPKMLGVGLLTALFALTGTPATSTVNASPTEHNITSKLERRIKLKPIKRRQMTPSQRRSLLERVDLVRKAATGRKAKLLKQQYRQQRRDFAAKWRSKLQNPTLDEADRQSLKAELHARRDALKSINAELDKDLEKAIVKSISGDERDAIELLEPNYLYEAQAFLPNDPQLPNQWSLQSINVDGIPLNDDATSPIIVATVDAGVDFDHPDLTANKWTDPNCVDSTNQPIPDGCPNGGYDVVNDDPDPSPTDSIDHGTAVASLIAADTDNGIGMASIGQNQVQLMGLRACCTADGFFTVDDIGRCHPICRQQRRPNHQREFRWNRLLAGHGRRHPILPAITVYW